MMMKSTQKTLAFSILAVLSLIVPAASQSPLKPVAEPLGAVMTSDQRVIINGASAQRGSTIFNGDEIQTGEAPASINLSSGGGVLSIAPGSRVKISRAQAKIIAEVLNGSITVRSPLASTVLASGRVVSSEPDNLYSVSVSDAGTAVESFLKSVAVKTADGATQTIAAQATKNNASPVQVGPGDLEPVTPIDGLFVTINCVLTFKTLMSSGIVACRGIPVDGARVILRVLVAGILPITQTTTTDSSGQYKFTITDDELIKGGTAEVTATTTRRGCARARNSCVF